MRLLSGLLAGGGVGVYIIIILTNKMDKRLYINEYFCFLLFFEEGKHYGLFLSARWWCVVTMVITKGRGFCNASDNSN